MALDDEMRTLEAILDVTRRGEGRQFIPLPAAPAKEALIRNTWRPNSASTAGRLMYNSRS